MAKAHAEGAERNVSSLSNDTHLKDLIVSSARDMAEIDAQRKKLNEQAADIRGALKDRGIDTDAFKDAYSYFKKQRHDRDGYDEYHKLCWDALNQADTREMFEAA